ncbi:unnamed protein product, partial [Prorocentrum cordatum]
GNQVAMSTHVDDGTLVGPRENAKKALDELGTNLILTMSELVVGGPEIKHIGRGWLRAPGCRQARTWPAIAKRLIDSGPYDRRTSPLLGIKGEKK